VSFLFIMYLDLKRNAFFCLRFQTNYWNVLPLTYTKGLQSHMAEMQENESKAYNYYF
jgi:hypothetical protein